MTCRQYQRLLLLVMLSDSELQSLKGHYMMTLPLSNQADARCRLLARGRQEDVRLLQRQYPAVPAAVAAKLAADDQGVGITSLMVDMTKSALISFKNVDVDGRYSALLRTFNQWASSLPSKTAADRPAVQTQLAEMFLQTAASCGYDDSVEEVYALRPLWIMAAGIGELALGAMSPMDHPWWDYAEAQLHIRDAASSDKAAQLLLGPHAIEPEHLG
jgi:hypothetical protein